MKATDWKVRQALLLSLGALLIFAANLRWSVGILAWIAPVPLLHALRLQGSRRSRLLVLLALTLAWCTASWKITTDPLPLGFAAVGVLFALFQWVPFLVWDKVRVRSEVLAPLAFAAAAVVEEFLQPRLTPLATWGSVAFTQLEDLPLLQVAALSGAAGITFLVSCTAAALEGALPVPAAGRGAGSSRPVLIGSLGLVVLAHLYGAVRLAAPFPKETVTVAAVGTSLDFGPSTPLPGPEERARALDTLLADTRDAVASGARLVVWTEASELVLPEEETAVAGKIRAAASELGVPIVAAYIVPLSISPLRFENVLLRVSEKGTVLERYLKHRPAPGEPAVVGTGPLLVEETPVGRLGAALCYDYDDPRISAEHGRKGTDLVALPSSDWRGIDPIHTQMAALRAVEQGLSIVRSTRSGLSAGIDPRGRMRGWQSSFESEDRVLRIALPRHRLPTVYARVGDWPVWASSLFLLGLGPAALRVRSGMARRKGASILAP